jgi:hypothetical protein
MLDSHKGVSRVVMVDVDEVSDASNEAEFALAASKAYLPVFSGLSHNYIAFFWILGEQFLIIWDLEETVFVGLCANWNVAPSSYGDVAKVNNEFLAPVLAFAHGFIWLCEEAFEALLEFEGILDALTEVLRSGLEPHHDCIGQVPVEVGSVQVLHRDLNGVVTCKMRIRDHLVLGHSIEFSRGWIDPLEGGQKQR